MTEEVLTAEYSEWLSANGLPEMAAEELIYEVLTFEQRLWATDFIERWNNL